MSEANFWDRIRKGLKEADGTALLSRVENMVEPGMPDVNFLIGGKEGWLELKWCPELPKRDRTAVFGDGGLRDAQVVWLHKRSRAGGRVFVLAQVEDMIFLVDGYYAKLFNAWSLEELCLNSVFRHMGNGCDWNGLIDVITGAPNDIVR